MQGYLDWEQYAKEPSEYTAHRVHHQSMGASVKALSQAHVLLAADVVYDVKVVSLLARAVRRFLTSHDKVAIFATTLRNRDTFDAFENELLDQGILCKYIEREILERVPYVFPVYHVQPRSDIRISFMRLSKDKSVEAISSSVDE